jgi:hypothetical protein
MTDWMNKNERTFAYVDELQKFACLQMKDRIDADISLFRREVVDGVRQLSSKIRPYLDEANKAMQTYNSQFSPAATEPFDMEESKAFYDEVYNRWMSISSAISSMEDSVREFEILIQTGPGNLNDPYAMQVVQGLRADIGSVENLFEAVLFNCQIRMTQSEEDQ